MAENGPFARPFWTQKFPPEKVYVGPFFCVLSQKVRHINFFRAPKSGVLGGAKKFTFKRAAPLEFPESNPIPFLRSKSYDWPDQLQRPQMPDLSRKTA